MSRDDDFEDDRPRRPRNSRDREDADDRPVRRRRDEDYDDAPRRGGNLAPHHGVLVLVLGILGLCCGFAGLAAFIVGIIDIGKMNKGKMDPSGKGLTMAGMIIGLVTFVLGIASNIYVMNNPNLFK